MVPNALGRFLKTTAICFGLSHGLAAPPTRATVIVDAVQAPAGTVSPLMVGDVLERWRLLGVTPARSGELAHWGDLDLLPFVEGVRGTLEVALVRGGVSQRTTLPAAAWIFKGRPTGASAELVAWVASFSAKDSTATIPAIEGRSPVGGPWSHHREQWCGEHCQLHITPR